MQDTACLGLVHGMTQSDVVGREMGGGFMFGNACTPVVDSCQCTAKPIQYCKVKLKKKKNSSFDISQKEKDKHYINTYTWSLERW